jgi:CHAT domain
MYQIDPNIFYVLVVPDGQPGDASPMQGFAPSLCRNYWMFNAASVLPGSTFDLIPDGRETFLARRMSGQYPVHIYPQSPRAARYMPTPPMVPFTVYILPEEEKVKNYADWLKSCPVPPTIVAKTGGDLAYEDLTIDGLRSAFLAKLENMPSDIDPTSIKEMKENLLSWKQPERSLAFQIKEHGSVRPNAAALTAAGYVDLISGPFDEYQPDWTPYVEQIVRTANAILNERDTTGERDIQRIYRVTPDVNLYAPAIYPHFFELPIPKNISAEEKRHFRLAREILRTQEGYSYTLVTDARKKAVFATDEAGKVKPRPHPIMYIRGQEVNLGTGVMCALAASEFSAVLRMPNAINRTTGTIRHFAEHYRSKAPTSRKRLMSFRTVQARLNAAFPPEFRDILRRSKTGIRVVSDAHLEWLDLDGLPLMLRKTCSRIPVTPGNLFVSEAGAQTLVHLSPDDLKKVLVISALRPDDPIAGLFDLAFSTFEKRWRGKLDITTVVVRNAEQLVDAINAFDGYLMVFDGHGGHEKDGPGKLYLQDEAVDVWSLLPKLRRVPPIVILSACDTHAADRNHATTANGFLSLGVRAVLGSVFPIDARSAAIFTARFLYRIADYFGPAIAVFSQGLRWSDVVTGMLRMQILSEFLRAILRLDLITEDQFEKIHVEGNLAINSDRDDPLGHVVGLLAALGLERGLLERELEMVVANSDVISYLHVGRPETILVDDPARIADQLRAIEARGRRDEVGGEAIEGELVR